MISISLAHCIFHFHLWPFSKIMKDTTVLVLDASLPHRYEPFSKYQPVSTITYRFQGFEQMVIVLAFKLSMGYVFWVE